jgi:hypothetical protein
MTVASAGAEYLRKRKERRGKEAEENPASNVGELREIIKSSAGKIKDYNPDNISKLREDDKDYETATEIAKKLIEEWDIPLYYSYLGDFPQSVLDLLKSRSEEEFLQKLEEYANDMAEWAENEEETFYDIDVKRSIRGSIRDIDNAEYIVKVYHTDPCWGMGQLWTVICCSSEEEAREVANIVWRKWGDFGVPGGNIGTKIEKVTSETSEKILEEYGEDMIRYSKYYHPIGDLEIIHASEVLDGDRPEFNPRQRTHRKERRGKEAEENPAKAELRETIKESLLARLESNEDEE